MQNIESHKTISTSDIVHTGPGTIAGIYMRMFWQPVCVAAELKLGRAKPLRIMSENFTVYREESGVPHVVAPRCPHRGTLLSTGWVEGDSLRCFYHGWKYGPSGQCVEAPAEREGSEKSVRIRSYPTKEYLGLIFAYLGDGEPPVFPRYMDIEGPGILESKQYFRDCNYFNNIENQADPVHVAFVHRNSGFSQGGLVGVPRVSAKETGWGIALSAKREGIGTRVTQLGMPNILHIKSSPRTPGGGWSDLFAWRVPLDDFSHLSFNIHLHRLSGEAAEKHLERQARRSSNTFPPARELAAAIRRGDMTIEEVKDHPDIVGIQDDVAQLGQGAIADRENEHLGRSDVGIALIRSIWLRELSVLADSGKEFKSWQWTTDLAATVGV
jgi:5,5'-dehydrodivanillate O-demethylase oxygenase subunit